MNLRLGLLRLVRALSADPSERRRLLAAAVVLQRQRRLSLSVLGPLIRIAPTCGKAKLQLWKHMSRTRAGDRLHGLPMRSQEFGGGDPIYSGYLDAR